jgi:hypothetical protein
MNHHSIPHLKACVTMAVGEETDAAFDTSILHHDLNVMTSMTAEIFLPFAICFSL